MWSSPNPKSYTDTRIVNDLDKDVLERIYNNKVGLSARIYGRNARKTNVHPTPPVIEPYAFNHRGILHMV